MQQFSIIDTSYHFQIITIVLLLFSGCQTDSNSDGYLHIHNSSDSVIYINDNLSYPKDSTYMITEHWGELPLGWRQILPNSTYDLRADPQKNFVPGSWSIMISECSDAGFASNYVVDSTVFSSLDSLVSSGLYPVLVRYDLTLEDIFSLDFNITFPPSEKMQDVHMYPPYCSFEE